MITEISRNQAHNIANPYQGKFKKVLTVCSAGLLRSATMQNFLISEYGYNVRNCGTEESYALIPISTALVFWADEIIFVNKENYLAVKPELEKLKEEGWKSFKIRVLDIPDMYAFKDPKLIEICSWQYERIHGLSDEYIEVQYNINKEEIINVKYTEE
jgi:predicted protein tyrosine phosphatase